MAAKIDLFSTKHQAFAAWQAAISLQHLRRSERFIQPVISRPVRERETLDMRFQKIN